jgi:hypothetical protein
MDMDVNEHGRLPNITKVKEQCFYCCSTFHCHRGVFNNENNSYPKTVFSLAPFYRVQRPPLSE